MSEDPTQNLPASQNSTLEQILVTVRSSENRLGNVESKLSNVESRLGNLEGRLESLESKVEERLYDTRPIWEKVEADIARLQEGQQRLEEGQRGLQVGQQRFDERLESLRDETRTGFRNLKRQFGVLHETFIEVRADYKDLDKRIYRFEEPLEEPHT